MTGSDSTDPAVVDLAGVSKSYTTADGTTTPVLTDVDLVVEAGDKVSLVGPSGCGKSTLLSLIAGLLTPTTGSVVLDGHDLGGLSDTGRAALRSRCVGIALQTDNLVPFLSAQENVELALRLGRFGSRRACRRQAVDILDRFEVAHRRSHRPGSLSGGEAQRVALAVAMAKDPMLVLADEVLAQLDGDTAAGVMAAVVEAPFALVLVTHDRALAATLPTRYAIENSHARRRVRPPDRPVTATPTGTPVHRGGIEVHDVVVEFATPSGPVRALSVDSFAVTAGDATAVMGPSGSGKSTLLALLAGLITPTAGTVTVAGTELSALSDSRRGELRRTTLGMVYQADNLLPHLTVEENVGLAAAIADTDDDPRWCAALLDTLGIGPLARRFPDQLSGGQRQRAAVARAVIHRPSLLLADEPTGALDPGSADAVVGVLVDAAAAVGATLVVVTHDPVVAARIGVTVHLQSATAAAG